MKSWNQDSYYCLSLTVLLDQKDLVTGICSLHTMLGCEEDDKGEFSDLRFFFDSQETSQQASDALKQVFPDVNPIVSVMENQDWNAQWRLSMKPVYITESIVVSPLWLVPQMKPADHWIKIEPKMAFGTGHHETTRLAAQALLALGKTRPHLGKVLDIGTGAGVLCFAADHAGYEMSIGLDIDPVCAENLAENKANNPSKHSVQFFIGTADAINQKTLFDVIVMNMIRPQSEPLLPFCKQILRKGGYVVWSGILMEEKESVVADAVSNGWKVVKEISENEWWGGVLQVF